MKRLFNDHVKRGVTELSGAWRFLTDPQCVGLKENWYLGLPDGETVIVPSVWNNELGMLNYEGACWYEKTFYTEGGTLLFEFESVMSEADVWLDGKWLGNHYGAFSQFELIANEVCPGTHTLIVRADNTPTERSIPQKKVDWFNYGGIARDVYVSALKGVSVLVAHLEYTLSSDLRSACVYASLELYNAEKEAVTSNVCVLVGDTEIYKGAVTVNGYEKVKISTPVYEFKDLELWSVDNPKLYSFTVNTDSDDLIDRVGFRKIEVLDKKICLNGKMIELIGVNRHEEHPDWGFAFPAKLMKRTLT